MVSGVLPRRRVPLALGLVAVMTVLSWALGSVASGQSSSPTEQKTILRVGCFREPDNLNPFIGWNQSSYLVWLQDYETVFGRRASDNQPAPQLAAELPTRENGGISEDGETVVVKLRTDVKWQDGVPFTAQDVAFTFNWVIDNQMGNYTSYTTGMKHVSVVDDHTVRFELTKPKADLYASVGNVPIVPQHIWKDIPPEEAVKSYVNEPPIVGTGPFQVVEWKKGSHVKLVANDSYWGGRPKIDELLFTVYTNTDTMAADVMTGNIDAAIGLQAAQFEKLDELPSVEANAYTLRGFESIGINCYSGKESRGHAALRDPAFRRALMFALDREKIAELAYMGMAKPGQTLLGADAYPDYYWEPRDDEAFTFDLDKAKEALDAAGYADTDGDGIRESDGKPIKLELLARTQWQPGQVVGKLFTGWLRDIGLKVTYQVVDEGVILDKIWNWDDQGRYAPDFDMYVWGWRADVDPNFLLSVLTTDQIENWSDTDWSNEEYDDLWLQQSTELDPQKRQDLIREMQRIAWDQAPYLVFAYIDELEAYNVESWEGWVQSPDSVGDVLCYTLDNLDTYPNVHKVEAVADEGGGVGASWIIAIAVCAAVVVVGVVVWLVRRRPQKQVEEG